MLRLKFIYTATACALLGACSKQLPPAERASVTLDASNLPGNAVAGKTMYQDECEKCHRIVAGKNHKGPQLNRIFGATAASLTDYTRYSDSIKNSNLIWTAENIDAYIKAPKQKIAGTKMRYDGLADANARQDVVAYLATLR